MSIEYIYWTNKVINTQKKIWKILRFMLNNKQFFLDNWINEISKHFKICKKTLKKYLKKNFYKLKWSKNEKRLYIKDKIELQFLKDLEKIVNKYDWYINNDIVRKWQYYLNNLRE